MTRLIILDRDGVINYDSPHYIKTVDECIFIPGSIHALGRLTQAGYTVGIATNQSGVSRGLYTEKALCAIHHKMLQAARQAGGNIDAIEYCIHLPQDDCDCRKPKPGMLFALAQQFHCSLEKVPFVGDRTSDIQAAQSAGADPVVIMSDMTDRAQLKQYPQVPIYDSLAEYVNQLLPAL